MSHNEGWSDWTIRAALFVSTVCATAALRSTTVFETVVPKGGRLLPDCPSSDHNLMDASPLAYAPAMCKFGGIVLSQCAAACV